MFRDTVLRSFPGYYNLSESAATIYPMATVDSLFGQLSRGIGHTDLLLLPR